MAGLVRYLEEEVMLRWLLRFWWRESREYRGSLDKAITVLEYQLERPTNDIIRVGPVANDNYRKIITQETC